MRRKIDPKQAGVEGQPVILKEDVVGNRLEQGENCEGSVFGNEVHPLLFEDGFHCLIVAAVFVTGEGLFGHLPVQVITGFEAIHSGNFFPGQSRSGSLLEKFLEKMMKTKNLLPVVKVVDEKVFSRHPRQSFAEILESGDFCRQVDGDFL